MIFDPPVMALLLVASVNMLALSLAAVFAVQLLRHWDPASGHARQIMLERRTQLVATLVRLLMLAQLPALVLFVHNADRMAVLFTGAMCALGTLNVNAYGMPAFLMQVAVFFLATVWLALDGADRLGRDWPLTRTKYALLLAMLPLVLAGGMLEWLHFLDLDPNVITSCCSRLFTPQGSGVQANLSSLRPSTALVLLFGGLVLLAALLPAALHARHRGWLAFGIAASLYFPVAVAAIISVVAPYIYASPVHHCPFCILKPQYGFIGYALYLPLFVATALALSITALSLRPVPASLRTTLPRRLRRFTIIAALAFATFGAVALHAIVTSRLILFP